MTNAKDPSSKLSAGFGFWESKVLLTAVEFDLFTVLADKAMTGPELGEKLGIHPRGIWDFFDTLVSLGYLDRTGQATGLRLFIKIRSSQDISSTKTARHI